MISDEVEYYKESLKKFDIKKQEIINSKKFKFCNFVASAGLSLFRAKNLDVKTINKKNNKIIESIIAFMVFSLMINLVASLFTMISEGTFGFSLLYMFIFYIIFISGLVFSLVMIEDKEIDKEIRIDNKKEILKIKKTIKKNYSDINILEYIIKQKSNKDFLESENEILYYGINNIKEKDRGRLFEILKPKIYECFQEDLINFNKLSLILNQYLEKLNVESKFILEEVKKDLNNYLKNLEEKKSLKEEIKEFSNIKNNKTLNNSIYKDKVIF